MARWRLEFGAHLRGLRIERGLSQEGLAQLARVDRKMIYRTELGQTSPRLDAVTQIARALGIGLDVLVGPGLPTSDRRGR